MVTFEDVTEYFLKAATNVGLTTHPEYWTNTRTLEREFACTCHIGSCEEADNRSTCTVSFTWSTLDTALSLEGPAGICEFFHEPGEACPHLHTRDIPPLLFDLSYNLVLSGPMISEASLFSLIQMLKLRASEQSSRATETRPGISMAMQDNRLQPEALTLQQRVEIPIWHPDGMRGLHELDDSHRRSARFILRQREIDEDEDEDEQIEVTVDNPRPEEWVPQVMVEVCQDILHGLQALEAASSHGSFS
jgi:hypothetical protein